MTLSLKLLGEFAVRDGLGTALSLPTRKTRALLGYLAANADRPQQRDRLMPLLWSNFGEKQARHNLNQALLSIRKLATDGATLLDGDAERVTLRGDAVDVDLSRFRTCLDSDPAAAAKLYDGPFLDGFAVPDPGFEDWLSAIRAELHDEACGALERAADAIAGDDTSQAIEFTRRLVALDPLREDAHRRLMRLLHDCGDRTGALRQYQVCADILKKELQVEPDAATRALYEEVRKATSSTGEPNTIPAQDVLPAETPPLLPDKLSIAVLAFDNLGGDLDQEYFADGMAEEVITALSKLSRMRVIARNSTFAYKGQATDIRRVAKELGVRYVLEGSVRSGGTRLRVTAQLIDARDGSHLWAERYDRTIDDIFDIQDEITKEIVTALRVKLTDGEEARVLSRGTNDIEAWQLCVRATELYLRFNATDYLEARDLAEKAIQRDPNYAYAWATLGLTFWYDSRLGYTADSGEKIARAEECAERAMALDDTISPAIALSAHVAGITGHEHEGVAIARRGVELYPSNADVRGMLGFALIRVGNYQEAVANFRAAMSLNPFYPNWYRNGLGRALMVLGEFDQALALADETLATAPGNIVSWIHKAYMFGKIGRSRDAEEAIRELSQIAPNLRLKHVPGMLMVNDTTAARHIVDGLRKTGFPE